MKHPLTPHSPSRRAVTMISVVAVLALALTSAELAAQQIGDFNRPAGSNDGIWSAGETALRYWYYFLYLLSPLTMYQAWQKYKEGDMKSFGAYIVATIGIFISPAMPSLFRAIGQAAGGFQQ